MKKRIISITASLALALVLALSVTAFAENTVDQDSSPASGTTTITTSVSPTYIVTIPADTAITFGATSTELGSVTLTSARLDPGYAVQVSAAAGALANQADTTQTIPYTLEDADGTFTSAQYTAAGESTALTVAITQDSWNSAYAGTYSGNITFTVEYINTTAAE